MRGKEGGSVREKEGRSKGVGERESIVHCVKTLKQIIYIYTLNKHGP